MAGEKRSQERENALHDENIVLVDIEGTTTSISFVKETLFPYVRENLKDYIEKKWDDAEFKEDLEKLKEQAKKDEADKVEGLIAIKDETPEESKASVMKNILWQMDNDRKTAALKQLQGHIWREAYKSGAVKGHVYDDVPKAFEVWTKNGRKIYVYSSGSVDAQKLLFGHTEHGDLLKHFSGYFDTEIGAKQDAASYKNIITKIGCEPSNIIFLTDTPKEAQAAIESGMASMIVVREGNTTLTADEKAKYKLIHSFHDLVFQSAAKRQKIEEISDSAKEVVKKTEECQATVCELMDTSDMTETTRETEKKGEKETKIIVGSVDGEQESKLKEDAPATEIKNDVSPMECETTNEAEKSQKETKSEDVSTKKVVESTELQASTSEIDSKKTEIDAKIPEAKIDEKVEAKSESSTSKTEEKKTESIDKVNETSKVELKPETEADKNEVKNDDKIKESTEDTSKMEEKVEVTESAATKSEEKVPEEKATAVAETKQNGDSKTETTESTSKTNIVTAAELNGAVTKEKTSTTDEVKEFDKITAEISKPDTVTDAEPAKLEPAKEEEKVVEEIVEKKLNGNIPTTEKDEVTAEKTHRNGVNEEKKQNGDDESTADKESIKVKKVVDSIVDGTGEPEVVPPVAVVAATS